LAGLCDGPAVQRRLIKSDVGDYSLLVPANAHIIVYMFQLHWLLHVSACRHPQGTQKPDKVKWILV